jgi:antitoxin (DNA-binding transcriptional repressor) of toxin-antitoxin stability system
LLQPVGSFAYSPLASLLSKAAMSEMAAFITLSMYNLGRIARTLPPRVMIDCGLDFDRWYPGARRMAGAAAFLRGMLPHLLAPDRRFVAESATVVHMARAVSIRELRNSTSAVVSELEAGERLTLTVNRRPVADILPHVEDRDPWVPASELRRIVTEAPADASLLDDLADVRGAELDD